MRRYQWNEIPVCYICLPVSERLVAGGTPFEEEDDDDDENEKEEAEAEITEEAKNDTI